MKTLAALAPLALVPVACAAPIQIDNPGFEADFAQTGSFPVGPVTDWPPYDPFNVISQGGNFTGVINPTGTDCFNQNDAPEGNNAALLYFAGSIGQGEAGLSQVLDATLQANTTYTLSVEVGNIASCAGLPPFDTFYPLGGFPGYSVQLLANGVVLAEDYNTLGGVIPEGEFMTSFAVVTAEQVNTTYAGVIGMPLEIRLLNLNMEDTPADPGIEVDFDDVQLDATLVSVPCNPADIDGDGDNDADDIAAFVDLFVGAGLADIDNDGDQDADDIAAFVDAFVAGCP